MKWYELNILRCDEVEYTVKMIGAPSKPVNLNPILDGGGLIVPAANFWSFIIPWWCILLFPPYSKFGHMSTIYNPDIKNVQKI